jgi:hypothetical protein
MGVGTDDYITRLSQGFSHNLVADAAANVMNGTAAISSKLEQQHVVVRYRDIGAGGSVVKEQSSLFGVSQAFKAA